MHFMHLPNSITLACLSLSPAFTLLLWFYLPCPCLHTVVTLFIPPNQFLSLTHQNLPLKGAGIQCLIGWSIDRQLYSTNNFKLLTWYKGVTQLSTPRPFSGWMMAAGANQGLLSTESFLCLAEGLGGWKFFSTLPTLSVLGQCYLCSKWHPCGCVRMKESRIGDLANPPESTTVLIFCITGDDVSVIPF